MDPNGKVSEWNEATLKIVRLHEIQATINLLKVDPMARADGKFHYELLLRMIDNLYGEGFSKYTPNEKKEVDKIQKLAKKLIRELPPHQLIISESHSAPKRKYKINQENLDMLMDVLDMFERKVKELNDDHGLTTKNKGHGGLF